MSETARADQTAGPFSAFERMMAWRYLRSRRKEAFISVIAGFFLPRHPSRGCHAHRRHGGDEWFPCRASQVDPRINGHLIVQPMDRRWMTMPTLPKNWRK